MLSGLLFAVEDAEDRDGMLAATQPFAGVTLLEYQARLLIEAGVDQLVVMVSRLTPEILGVLARIGRRGVMVDAVRSATEASTKLHPLAEILVLADGLICSGAAVASLAGCDADTLIVLEQPSSMSTFELIGGGVAWAGMARLHAERMIEVARMPRDYDLQSALLRSAEQARARHHVLDPAELREGHGIARHAAALEEQQRRIVAGAAVSQRGWFDHWVGAPSAKLLIQFVVRRSIATSVVAGATVISAAAGFGLISLERASTGLIAALLATVTASAGVTLARLRDQSLLRRFAQAMTLFIPPIAVLLAACAAPERLDRALILAMTLILLGALAERAFVSPRWEKWRGQPAGYLAIVTVGALTGSFLLGVASAAVHAAITLAVSIEALRKA